jgi:hypothetical protein
MFRSIQVFLGIKSEHEGNRKLAVFTFDALLLESCTCHDHS